MNLSKYMSEAAAKQISAVRGKYRKAWIHGDDDTAKLAMSDMSTVLQGMAGQAKDRADYMAWYICDIAKELTYETNAIPAPATP